MRVKLIALVAALLVATVAAGVGISAVVTRTVLADVTNIHYTIVKQVADGFDSGWHIHPGLAIVQVQEGSVQVTTQGSCTPKTYNAGDTFIEVPFTPVRAVATGRFVWTVSFLIPYELPNQINVDSPCP